MACQFAAEADEKIVHRAYAGFDFDRPDFDLIDLEQRIQHVGHGADRFVDPTNQLLLLLPGHLVGEQPLEQRECL